MKKFYFFLVALLILGMARTAFKRELWAQEPKTAAATEARTERIAKSGQQYSGMYSFLKDGEFVQVTVEEAGKVSGFVSRFGDGESDKGAFLDQFFKSGKIDGNKLSLSTDIVHGVAFDFKGTGERGDGKNPGEEGEFALKGTLTESDSDENKKVTTHAREVVLKLFPQEAAPAGK